MKIILFSDWLNEYQPMRAQYYHVQSHNVVKLYWFVISPNTSQDVTGVEYSDELIVCGSIVKVSSFFIDKESVGHPNQFNILCPHHKLI